MAPESAPNPRLAQQRSAYLRGASHQPVQWHAWGMEAFAAARGQGKPILLDIGAVWCHWCHVMDGESYEDPALARLINERFVAIKVDRDERPDVDARYQRLVAALSGQGGWPLTAFLDPDGNLFFGGTYFPPSAAHGRPSFRQVLESVADAYAKRRAEVLDQARRITDTLAQATAPISPASSKLGPAWMEARIGSLGEHFDEIQGGWGHAPKFPHPSAIELLLVAYARTRKPELLEMAQTTLRGMGRGGVYDQVGSGFHRYSVDAEWHVPHFEKMLYDNAELLRAYVHAWRIEANPFLADRAHGTWRFLVEVLGDSQRGGFGGSQDADVHFGDDGDHYTWTRGEVGAAVNDEALARLLFLRFGIEDHGPMHHNPHKNVLRIVADLEDVATAQHRPLETVRTELERGLGLLRQARARRKAPFVDPVLYANWNGMAIRAALEYAAVFDRPEAAEFGLLTLHRFLREGYTAEAGFLHTLGGAPVGGLLDDQAQMLPALVVAFLHTQDARYLERAQEVADLLLKHFWDETRGAFRDLSSHAQAGAGTKILQTADYPLQDAPSPSANARAAEGLLFLDALVEDARYRRVVDQLLAVNASTVEQHGIFCAALATVAHHAVWPPAHVVIAGPAGDEGVTRLHRAALSARGPADTVRVVQPGEATILGRLPEAAAFAQGPARMRAAALVCVGTRCLAPMYEPDTLAKTLRNLPP